MEFSLKHNTPEKAHSACQILTVSQARKLSSSALRVDKSCKGLLTSILKRGDMEGKLGQTLLLPSVPGVSAQRLLLVGCGKDSDMNERNYTRVINSIVRALAACGARDAEFYAFTKSLETYELTMDPSTIFILGTDSELLRFLEQPQ